MNTPLFTFSDLRAANRSRQAEWDQDNKLTLTYRANELAGEVGEACNIAKKIERERLGITGGRATLDQLADELADVVITADLVAMGEGIDLKAAVIRKFNATSEKVGLLTRMTDHIPDAGKMIRPNADLVAQTLNQVIQDIATELGCDPDNEEILQAIHDLKRRAANGR